MCFNYCYYWFYLLPDAVPFSSPCRLLSIYRKNPLKVEKLRCFFTASFVHSIFVQLICSYIFSLLCVLCFLNMLEDLKGEQWESLVVCQYADYNLAEGNQFLKNWNGTCPVVSSYWILCAVWNCWRIFCFISHFAAVCKSLFIKSIWVILFVPALANS